MSAILILCMILPLAAGFSAWFSCRMEESLLLAVLTMITVGYGMALSGMLWLSGPMVWLLNGAGGAWAWYAFCVKKKIPARMLWQGIVLFLVLAMLYWWLCRGYAFTDWDDFSHWGKAVKWMYGTDTMYTVPASTDGFKSYPPATALWQYMILKAGGFPFREDVVLYANALLTAALLVLPFRAVDYRHKPFRAIGMAVLMAVLPGTIYPSWFQRASVDGLLGLFAGIMILSAFLPGRSRATPWLETVGCFVLALVKTSGTGLAAMAALVMLGAGLRAGRRQTAVFPLPAVLGAKLSWSVYLTLMGAGERWQWPGGLTGGIFSLVTGRADEYRYTVLKNFAGTIFFQGNYGPGQTVPFMILPAVLAVFTVLTGLSNKKSRRKTVWRNLLPPAAAVLAVTGVFVLSLLYSYLYLFSSAEAMYLASIYRYLDTCTMMLMTAAIVLPFVFAGEGKCCAVSVPVALAVVWLFPAGSFLRTVMQAPQLAAQSQNDRVLCRQAADRIRALGESSPRLQLITANDAGAAALRIDYELVPERLPEQLTILKTENPNGEPWVHVVSAEEWSRELAQYFDYVYLYCPEDQFVADYLSVFEDESQVVVDRMFRVVVQPDGTARLRCLDE